MNRERWRRLLADRHGLRRPARRVHRRRLARASVVYRRA